MILDLDQFATEHGTTTKEDLVHALRIHCGQSATGIISLASTELRAKDPELLAYCDQEVAWFFDDLGNCFYDCWDGVRHGLENGPLLATKPTTGDLRNRFAGMPAICLGAGPGVNPRWDAIKASRGHAVLIVCDVMLEPCLAHGIVPDFVASLERTVETYECMAGLDKTGITLLGTPVLEKRIIDDFAGRVIWTWRGCGLEKWIDPTIPPAYFGRSCGTQSVTAALIAGCSPIYLVGHDLCMDGDRTHCAGANTLVQMTSDNLDKDDYHRRMPAKSISGRDVTTIHLWRMFQADIQHVVKDYTGGIVVNTGDGLPIHGTFTGELPETWGSRIEIPVIQREKPGLNRNDLVPLMLEDIPIIEKAMRLALEMETPDETKLQLSKIVRAETAQVWTEIFGGTYSGALIRLHLQPTPFWKQKMRGLR